MSSTHGLCSHIFSLFCSLGLDHWVWCPLSIRVCTFCTWMHGDWESIDLYHPQPLPEGREPSCSLWSGYDPHDRVLSLLHPFECWQLAVQINDTCWESLLHPSASLFLFSLISSVAIGAFFPLRPNSACLPVWLAPLDVQGMNLCLAEMRFSPLYCHK